MPGSFRPHKGCIGVVKVTFSRHLDTGARYRGIDPQRHNRCNATHLCYG